MSMGHMSGMGGMSGMSSTAPSMSMPTGSSDQSMESMMQMMDSMMQMGYMTMQNMAMVFFSSSNTPLYSLSWTPQNNGQYAGTCIFLIVLSLILRALYAFKAVMEAKWLQNTLKRRYVVVSPDSSSENSGASAAATKESNVAVGVPTATLTTNGLTEKVKLVQRNSLVLGSTWRQPWRLSVDLPRALIVTVMVGIGYLLMLAVMTMNVGYFLSVLAGAFVGELFFGRYSPHVEDHH